MTLEEAIKHLEDLHHCYITCNGDFLNIRSFDQLFYNQITHIKFVLKQYGFVLINIGAIGDELEVIFRRDNV